MSSPLSAASASVLSDDAIINNANGEETTTTNTNENPDDMTLERKQQDEQQQPPQDAGTAAAASGIEIYIHSPTTTTSSGGGLDGSGPLSPQTISMAQYSRPKRFRKLSNSSSIISEIFRHPSDDISEQRLRVKIKRANERDTHSKDLIEFLRTTSPPPRPTRCSRLSFSLNPYGGAGGNRSSSSSFCGGRKTARIPFWAVCRRLKARRGKQHGKQKQKEVSEKSPAVLPDAPLLKLPDSAVAGRTIGGHRHIAISIPVEYDHLGEEEPKIGGPSSSAPVVRPAASPSIGMERVPPRASSAAVNSVKPQPMIRSHTDAGSSSLLPRKTENPRPRTADPQAGQWRRTLSFEPRSPIPGQPNSAMEMHYPVVRNQHSFGYTNTIGYHESPDGVSFQRHHHWSWPSGGPQSGQLEQTSFSLDNNPEAKLANAMVFNSPYGYLSPTTGMVSDIRRGQSMSILPFQHPHNMGVALSTSNSDMRAHNSTGQLSYREIINHHNSYPELSSSGSEGDLRVGKMTRSPQLQTVRSLTFDLPPGYQPGGQHHARINPLSDKSSSGSDNSAEATKEQSKVKEPEPEPPRLRLSSIMTVAEVKPSFSVEALPVPEKETDNGVQVPASEVLSPQPTRVPRVLSADSLTTTSHNLPPLSSPLMEGDGESTPKASSSFAARSARQEHRLPAVTGSHHRPTIEEVLFPEPNSNGNSRSPTPRVANVVSPKGDPPRPAPTPTPTAPSTTSHPAAPTPSRASKRTASHQALAEQYEALRETRDQEMTILLDRLERLENKNDWWLNSVVPMVENMTRRLTRDYDDESLPRMARERERAIATATRTGSSNRAVSGSTSTIHRPVSNNREEYMDLSTESSLDSFLPPLTLSRPSEFQFQSQSQFQAQPSGEGQQSLLEPESSHESFDSFNFGRRQYLSQLHQQHSNRPNTSIAPPSPTRFEPEPEPSSPYPYPYIYPGESLEEPEQERFYPLQVPGVGVSEGRNAGHVSISRLRYNSSNDSLPQGGFLGPPINMGMGMGMGRDTRSSISSTWDHQPDYHRPHHHQAQPQPLQPPFQPSFQERAQTSFGHDNANTNTNTNAYSFNRDFNFDFGHGMGLAVDRLPSRHGEKGPLNSIAVPGGSGSGGNDSRDGTTPSGRNSPYHHSHAQSRLSYPSSARTARPLPRPRSQSMFIPRRADCAADYGYNNHGYETNFFDENDSEQEYYDEDEDELQFDNKRRFLSGLEVGTRQQQPEFSINTSRRKSVDKTRRVSFLQPLVQQGNTTSSSRSRFKARRPISWPSSYRPQQAAQTQTQTRAPQPQLIIRRRERELRGPTTGTGSSRQSSDEQNHRQQQQEQQEQNQQQQPQQQRQTEWDTLEPLMRGLTETTQLDLELGRDLDLI